MSQLSDSHYDANSEAALPVRGRRKVRVTADEGYRSAGASAVLNGHPQL